MTRGKRGQPAARARRRSGLALMEGHAPSVVIACLNAIRVNDASALAEMVPSDIRVDDRRVASNRRFDDGGSLIDTLAQWGAAEAFDIALLAHRGTSHALVRLNLALQGGTVGYVVMARCARGQIRDLTIFDPAEVDVASWEMAHRWADDQPAAEAGVIRVSADWLLALCRRDFDKVRSLTSPDVTLRDHRLDLAAVSGPDETMSLFKAVCDNPERIVDLPTEAVGFNSAGILCWRNQATPTQLEDIDEELGLVVCRDGLVAGLELFDADQIERACARLEAVGLGGA